MSDPASLCLFQNAPSRLRRTPLKQFARRLVLEVAGGREFVCLFTNDDQLCRLNRKWRGKNEPTDVLSFPAGAAPSGAPAPIAAPWLGEIAISCQRARFQASEHGHSLEAEIAILMLHGVLHLMGMDHEADNGQMLRVESKWRKRFELPGGLIERSGRRRKGRAV